MLSKCYYQNIISCRHNHLSTTAFYIKIFIIFINLINSIETWAPDIKPKISLNTELKNVPSFFGNSTDYFKILDQDDTSILIGARNHVYNLSLDGLRKKYQIEWFSSDADRELCALKGKSEQDCQNYIRVHAKISSTQIMICGTNSYKPRCRFYAINNNNNFNRGTRNNRSSSNNIDNTVIRASSIPSSSSSSSTTIKTTSNHLDNITTTTTISTADSIASATTITNNGQLNGNNGSSGISGIGNPLIIDSNEQFQLINEVEAQGRCPYNPQHNSTYIYTDGQLYSATVADFSGADPLIYRETLRTEQYDLKQLNQPAFVSALERNGYVFFFFREIAMEYMNCGKTIYSRVGRVCKNDRGGPYAFSDRWTSYLKTRLNCSVPGEYPFYFDEIQSTSKIIDGFYPLYNGKNSIVYGIFTTSVNAIPGSAICAFNMNDILDSFEGKFKYQKDSTSNWLPLSKDDVPEPRPGKCVDDSRTLSSTSVNFVKTHTLMEQSIMPLYGKPLLTRVSLNYRLTAITVDSQIKTINNNTYDIIFVGTDNGKIIKFTNIYDNNLNDIKTIVISEMDALPKNSPIRELTVSKKTQSLIVIGDGHITSLPLHYCSHIQHCKNCLNLQDPYCVWDISNYECKSIITIQNYYKNDNIQSKNYIQMLNTTSNIDNLCKKYGGHSNNDILINNNNQINTRPRIISTIGGNRGTVTGTGKPLINNNNYNDIGINNNNNGYVGNSINNHNDNGAGNIDGSDIRSIYTNYKDTNGIQSNDDNDNNRITLTSINPEHIDKSIGNPYLNDENLYGVEGEKLQYASSNLSWSIIIIVVIFIVFAIGIVVGWHASRRLCKSSVFHTEHRNQLNPKTRPITYRNSGKDVNLLMNTSNPFSQPCNNKKDNIEHEFVSEKDRSHECKNSTENLEKEVHFSKTGTLTKVKRTYI